MNVLEWTAAAFGVASVALMVRQNVWAWPVGLVNVGLYILWFRSAHLYAAMGLHTVYVVLCLYGWYHWLRGGGEDGPLRAARAPRGALLLALTLGAAGFFALGTLLHRLTDASVPFLDSALAAFSLVAQWLQARKWIENWHVWIAVDVVYVGFFTHQAHYPTAGLYAAFLVLAVLGLRAWRQSLDGAAPSPIAPGA